MLDSVQEFYEVILVDSGSTDNTLEIAKKYDNCKIFHQEWLGFAGQKAFALNKCSNEWVVNLDADEEISLELKDEIKSAMLQSEYVALESPMIEDMLGKKPSKYTFFNSKIRCFKKDCGSYESKLVHESIKIKGRVKKVTAPIYHHPNISLSELIAKQNKYSQLRAEEKFNKGKNIGFVKLLLVFPFTFLKSYFLKRNFLNGSAGLIISMQVAYYSYCKYAKLWELNNKK